MTDFPEAPASNTFKVKSPKGFEHLFTMRDETVKGLMTKIESIETILIDKGWTPLAQNAFSKPQVPTKPCSIHRVDMKEKTSKDGKKFFSHSRGVYPNLEYCNGQGFPSDQTEESHENLNDVDF